MKLIKRKKDYCSKIIGREPTPEDCKINSILNPEQCSKCNRKKEYGKKDAQSKNTR